MHFQPFSKKDHSQLRGGLDGFQSLIPFGNCVRVEKQKPQFLCRTELTGALGAILAQDPRAPDDEICFPTHPP